MTVNEFVRYMGQKPFYHFTDLRNIPLIKTRGLLSLRELKKQEIDIPAAGGNQWSHDADERIGLDGHVHLCLWDEHPMEYIAKKEGRIQNSRFLRIKPDVLSDDGIRFTPDVSNKAGCPIYTFDEALEKMDFEVVYERTDWKDPAIQSRLRATKKYELLVPGSVAIALISGLE